MESFVLRQGRGVASKCGHQATDVKRWTEQVRDEVEELQVGVPNIISRLQKQLTTATTHLKCYPSFITLPFLSGFP